jgi:hypothetical protein
MIGLVFGFQGMTTKLAEQLITIDSPYLANCQLEI